MVSGFHTMRFTDGLRSWRYSGKERYALGTSLCYRKDWWQGHRFPDDRIGEDNAFVGKARDVIVSTDAGEMMYATIHNGNTSPRTLRGKNWKEL